MTCFTKSQAEYLRAVYQVSLQGDVKITKIADYLNYSKPSVVRGLKGLEGLELIKYHPKIKLTEKGKAYAQNIIRHDQILYRFLTEILKIDSKTAQKDVEQIKYSVSCYTVQKLENYIYQILKEKKPTEYQFVCQYEKCSSCH